MSEETTNTSLFKKHKWLILVILFYFLSIVAIGFKSGIAIGLFELAFLITGIISSFRVKSYSALKGLAVLALLAFLILIGLAEIVAGTLIPLHTGPMVSSIGTMYLGILTIIIAISIYENVSWENKKRRKEEKIELEAYLKKKGELKAEKEESLLK